jgi:hypothetical protein
LFGFFKEFSGKRELKKQLKGAYMSEVFRTYLTKEQCLERFGFLSENMLKNLLFKDVCGFRSKVVIKLGRRNLYDLQAFQIFLSNNKGGANV